MITTMFYTYNEASNAINALKAAGVTDSNLSLISNDTQKLYDMEKGNNAWDEAGEGAGVGSAIGAASGLLAGLGIVAIPGMGPVIAAGWLAATLAGMAAGGVIGATTGGVMGLLTDQGLPKEDVDRYASHVRQGGTLVCVRGNDLADEEVRRILVHHQDQEVLNGFTSYQPLSTNTSPRGSGSNTGRGTIL